MSGCGWFVTASNNDEWLVGSLPYDSIVKTEEVKNKLHFGSGNEILATMTICNLNVGINETEPDEALHINREGNNEVFLKFTNDSTGTGSNDGFLVGLSNNDAVLVHQEESYMSFWTNNNQRMTISPHSDYVGIGTNTPRSNLDVIGDTIISGSVGIGTTSPETSLDIRGITTTEHVIPREDITYDLGSPTNRYRDIHLGPSTIHLGVVDIANYSGDDTFFSGGIAASNTQITGVLNVWNDDTVARFYSNSTTAARADVRIGGSRTNNTGADSSALIFENYDNDIISRNELAKISGRVTEPVGNSAGSLNLFTASNYTFNLAMTLDEESNIGVGTDDPTSKLHVYSTENETVAKFETTATGFGGIEVITGNEGQAYVTMSDGIDNGSISYSNADMLFEIPGSNLRMIIEGDTGRVGIGTDNPTKTLEVYDDLADTRIHINSPNDNPGLLFTGQGGDAEIVYDQFGRIQIQNPNDTPVMIIDDAGFVYIGGGLTPRSNLDVDGDTIMASGTLGIGTTYANELLHVHGTGTVRTLIKSTTSSGAASTRYENNIGSNFNVGIGGSTNGDNPDQFFIFNQGTTRMSIDQDGNVGIGTNNPLSRLHIFDGDGTACNVLIEGGDPNNNIDSVVTIKARGTGAGSSSILNIYGQRNNDTVTELAQLNFGNYDNSPSGSDNEIADLARISMIRQTAGNREGNLIFSTKDDSMQERVRITYDGEVGIGTNNPAQELHVYAPTGNCKLQLECANDAESGLLLFQDTSDTANDGEFGLDLNGNMFIECPNGSVRLIVQPDGNVGIGTTTADDLLHVYGSGNTRTKVESTTNTGSAGVRFENNSGTTYSVGLGGSTNGDNPNNFFIFDTQTRFCIETSSGYVGIGTNNPSQILHGYSTSGVVKLRLETEADSEAGVLLFQNTGGTTTSAEVKLDVDGDVAIECPNGTERMTIQASDGYVGIGTNDANHMLHLYQASGNPRIYFTNSTTGVTAGSDGFQIGLRNNTEAVLLNRENDIMSFWTNDTQRMTINAGGNVGIATTTTGSTLTVNGSVSKTSGSFLIDHPNPVMKEQGYKLKHCFVESPTAGDNIYRFECQSVENNQEVIIELPDYYRYLNENTQVFVSPVDHFGRAYGKINQEETQLLINCETKGKYNVMCIGTRKDKDAVEHFETGIEYIEE